MAAKPKKKARKAAPKRRTGRLGPAAVRRGLTSHEIVLAVDDPMLAEVVAAVRKADGSTIGAYREPLSGRPLLLASLPFSAIEPTPFQRDLSPTHAKRLSVAIEATGAFLDPLIVVLGEGGRFWTPNGRHRLAAAKVLGLKQITALISPDESLSYRILALNTEKAHNLKDKSLEVIRMARSLAKREPAAKESGFGEHFEAAELLTLGAIYEKNPRFGGGAYSSFLKKVDRFSEKTLTISLRERADLAARLVEIDLRVKRIVTTLQERGMKSPYLRNYVVARINPVRFHRLKPGDRKPAMPVLQAMTRMAAAAREFDLAKVSLSDLAFVAAGAESAE
ncbi:MAG TPA: ParB/RepB/Spo0J family partition protein [Steroidobacteraceae bacterium]|nr:ParB/RepB/Spo0J family partition protein [Steroidobacteraceae bacterium]